MRVLAIALLLGLALGVSAPAEAHHCRPGDVCVCDSPKCEVTHAYSVVRDLVDRPCVGPPGSC